MKQFTITGNTTKDIELKTVKDDIKVATVTIAVNTFNKITKEPYAEFYDISVFGYIAEKLAKYAGKGSNITLQGKLSRTFKEIDGKKTYYTNFTANFAEINNRKAPAGEQTQTQEGETNIDNQLTSFNYPIEDETNY